MKETALYNEVIDYLRSLNYWHDASVWVLGDEGDSIGFVVVYSAIDVGLMVYHPDKAESGYFFRTASFRSAKQFIDNIHWLNKCSEAK